MKTTTLFGVPLLVALACGLAAGCAREDESMGPAQKAGKVVDEAGQKVAGELRAPLDKADEAARQAVERADAARERLAERTEAARAKIHDATAEAERGLEKATGKVGEKVERAGEKMQEAAN
ncbi:glycosyltransferase family 1 protein [Massilia sp. Dwa41.01b]|uniref:hypothetical protein n=1 Tax=Massilia sp. Dwa41.01b TaxID=2709302 RepID=UPI0016004AFF|nr:hypothetical protein [Massilia sp. Dwa41.01b]QNA90261.1 glycosyltransferase family 1 protein [Massilia sp. Dwa41.01b]